MNDSVHECYRAAGTIAAKVRKEAQSRIKENITLLEIAEYVENRIEDLGGRVAFPCNISINEIASHFTPQDHQQCFKKGDVVKLDVGAHIEGYIADTAATIEVGTNEHKELISTCEEALKNAIAITKDRAETGSIGKIIEETIKKNGFNPIIDVTGHNLERYDLHAGITIPNYKSIFSKKIRSGMVFAIEPFATYGKGKIKHGNPYIFSINGKCERIAALAIMERFGPLPFTPRWISGLNIKDLGKVREYFELIETGGNIVAQAEHTVIVTQDGCEVITK